MWRILNGMTPFEFFFCRPFDPRNVRATVTSLNNGTLLLYGRCSIIESEISWEKGPLSLSLIREEGEPFFCHEEEMKRTVCIPDG